MGEYLAHVDGDRTQTVTEHLRGVSRLCGEFAGAFGGEAQGAWIGLAHDIGKCSDKFQQRLRGGRRVDHATAGAIECVKADPNAVWAAACVAGHHSGLADMGRYGDSVSDGTLWGRIDNAEKRIPPYHTPVTLSPPPSPPDCGADMLAWSFYIRMLYSCLVDADFLDTEAFMSGGTIQRGAGDPLPVLLDRLRERRITPWLSADNRENPLNARRCEILRVCVDGGTRPRGLYTLTVPTGGGKTVASMAFALCHAVEHGMARVIYVIPYTSIIEQTAAVFREIFGPENVLEHHSAASQPPVSGKERGADTADCAADGPEVRAALAAENWDAPIIVTTAVQFFESLYANRPAKCRKLHNIANSVIIFDEAQTLPVPHLLPCTAAIAYLVKQFRATAVLCTATQPALDRLFQEFGLHPAELCPGTADLYEQFRRVTFRDAGTLDADTLADRLGELPQVLCVVNTRRAAQEVYRRLPREGSFHLSTLLYPAHRRAALAEIRDRLARNLPCRVVSTSLIEAGVDVDFPAVWREKAGLDSILQAAGRCNREGKHGAEESIVTVFDGVSRTPEMLKPGLAAAVEALRSGMAVDAPETVARYFNTLYYDYRGSENLDVMLLPGAGSKGVIRTFREGFQGSALPFRTATEHFHMINDSTKTVYIPMEDGEGLLNRLRFAGPSRQLYRELGQYAVNVYRTHYEALLSAGYVEPLDEDSGILRDLSRYQQDTGLSLNEGEMEFLSI